MEGGAEGGQHPHDAARRVHQEEPEDRPRRLLLHRRPHHPHLCAVRALIDKISHFDTVILHRYCHLKVTFHIDTGIFHIDCLISHIDTISCKSSSMSILSSSISILSSEGHIPYRKLCRHLFSGADSLVLWMGTLLGAASCRTSPASTRSSRRRTWKQGLTLVHYSAQPEPFSSLKLNNYSPKKC